MRLAVLSFASLLLSAPLSAQVTVIDFDGLQDRDIVTTQFAGVTFSSAAGFVNYVTTQPAFNGSKPNFLCTGPVNAPITCRADTYIDFATAVSGVRFNALGIDDAGLVAQVHVFDGTGLLGTVDVIGASQRLEPLAVDLSGFSGVRRVELVNILDGAGIGWDDFQFTAAQSVPESTSWLLLAAGAGLLVRRGAARRRVRQR